MCCDALLPVYRVIFGDVSPYVQIIFSSVATFWERADHSVDNVFFLYFDYLYFYLIPVFGFDGGIGFRLLQLRVIAYLLLFNLITYEKTDRKKERDRQTDRQTVT